MKILELKNITKTFGNTLANDRIDLDIEKGEVHCLLGENGAGKTTLMNILFGLYAADRGSIHLNGKPVEISGPSRAIRLGIGMIHQNFMLVDRLSVAENIVAGCEPRRGWFLDLGKAKTNVKETAEKYGFRINPDVRVEHISVGEQQRVEILKALYRNADLLILDEPTAVLTPSEVGELFLIIRKLKADGKTIIFITHKLKETLAISDRITVLRDGGKVGTLDAGRTCAEELARMMVGRDILPAVDKKEHAPGAVLFEINDLEASNPIRHLRLKRIRLRIHEGEIVGIAGIEGNGQLELEEAIMGLRAVDAGRILLDGENITRMNTAERRSLGMVHIPSDRLRRGLLRSQSIEQNILLGAQWRRPFSKRGILSQPAIESASRRIIDEFHIRCSGSRAAVDRLSGGNQQKLVIGRELSRSPKVIIAAHPTRGLDIGAVAHIHALLLRMRQQNRAVLLISAELDELRALSDRILVLYEGRIVSEGASFTEEALGLLMAGSRP